MKKFFAFAIAAVMLISLTACSGNEVTGSNVAGGKYRPKLSTVNGRYCVVY